MRKVLKRKEEDAWRERMKTKSKLRLYRKIKTRLVLEEYLIDVDREKRRQLTMIRGGTNHLRIERGRWEGEPEEERVCNVCLGKAIEDEKHFLLDCPMYARERANMFKQIRVRCQLENVEIMDEECQLDLLIGHGWKNKSKEIREVVLENEIIKCT